MMIKSETDFNVENCYIRSKSTQTHASTLTDDLLESKNLKDNIEEINEHHQENSAWITLNDLKDEPTKSLSGTILQ